jgi:hypothetical protein
MGCKRGKIREGRGKKEKLCLRKGFVRVVGESLGEFVHLAGPSDRRSLATACFQSSPIDNCG